MVIINNVFLNYNNNNINTTIHGKLNGTAYPVLVDNQGRLDTTIGNIPETAFGELRCTFLTPVAGWTFNYTLLNAIVKFTNNTTGTYTIADSMISLSTGTSTDGLAKVETRDAIIYSPGTGTLVRFTSKFTTGVPNSQQIIGVGDDLDGFYFGYDGANFGVLRRRGGVDFWTYQSNWSKDKLDGSGNSGMTLNTSKGNVYSIQYQWLGFGAINFYIENELDGKLLLVHQIQYANLYDKPSLFNPTLPLMAEVKNTGNNTDLVMSTPSAMAFAEGSYLNRAISSRFSYYVEELTLPPNSLTTVFALRNKTTFNSKLNRVRIGLDFLSASTNGSKLVNIEFLFNPTITGGTFNDISTNQSVIEYSTDATYTGGLVAGFLSAGAQDSLAIDLTPLYVTLNPGDILFILAKSTQVADVSAAINWVEYY